MNLVTDFPSPPGSSAAEPLLLDVDSSFNIVGRSPGDWQRKLEQIDSIVAGHEAFCHASVSTAPFPAEIVPGVFLGTLQHSCDQRVLVQCRIAQIFDCSASPLMRKTTVQSHQSNSSNRELMAFDNDSTFVSPGYTHLSAIGGKSGALELDVAVQYLTDMRKKLHGASIMVVCLTGLNRAPTVCAAWLIRSEKMTLQNALKNIRDAAGPVIQLAGFQEILLRYAIEHRAV